VTALQRLRDIVAIPHPILGRMGYDHFVAGIVEQQSRQQGFDFCLLSPMRPLLGEPGLNSIEQRSVEQRRLWTCQDLHP
jgi:hypothetical protein